jgi:exodeoxyribonuclease VII large subunit
MDLFEPTTGDNTPEFTVSEIAGSVRKLVETELGWVRVRGEVGRVVHARSGHLYFDLKDDRSVLSCMTWKGQVPGLSVRPEEGMEVIAEGKMTASGLQSKFGLNVQTLAVAGEGALMAMLEKRKKALQAEGLFDAARKKPLPYLPEVIGVVTSPQGAVIRDILHRLRDRFPRKVLVWPVAVQGKECAPQVARAIRGFDALTPGGALPRPDLIIVARGGGSIEDLWGFNEEEVARAVAACSIPLISAVGHETDTTLIDFVSDRRAPTPTAAAEMAVPVRLELLGWTEAQEGRLLTALERGVRTRRQRLSDLSRALPRPEALLAEARQRLDRAEVDLPRALRRSVEARETRLTRLSGALRPALLKDRVRQARDRLRPSADRLGPSLASGVSRRRDRFEALARRHRVTPIRAEIANGRDRLADLSRALERAQTDRIARLTARLDALDRMRASLGYLETLKRGYAVVRGADGVVTTATAARSHAALEIEFADGRVGVTQAGGGSPARKKPEAPGGQGSLF